MSKCGLFTERTDLHVNNLGLLHLFLAFWENYVNLLFAFVIRLHVSNHVVGSKNQFIDFRIPKNLKSFQKTCFWKFEITQILSTIFHVSLPLISRNFVHKFATAESMSNSSYSRILLPCHSDFYIKSHLAILGTQVLPFWPFWSLRILIWAKFYIWSC